MIDMKASGQRILLLGVYGMEMVECGGVLRKNVRAGGSSHASIMFAGEGMREGLPKAAELLGCTLEYLDMDSGEISGTLEEKLKVVKVIRTFRPDIIITQDPEHCVSDLDPGRRPAMTILLEGMALAGRAYGLELLSGLRPHRDFAVYYMTPERPNCLVDISGVWDEKCRAMDALESQLAFIGELMEGSARERQYAGMIPGFDSLSTSLERGTAAKRLMDQAYHLYHGSTGHNDVFLSEGYRREGMFILDNLVK